MRFTLYKLNTIELSLLIVTARDRDNREWPEPVNWKEQVRPAQVNDYLESLPCSFFQLAVLLIYYITIFLHFQRYSFWSEKRFAVKEFYCILRHVSACGRCTVIYNNQFRRKSEVCCCIGAPIWGQSWECASASLRMMEKAWLHPAADSDDTDLGQLRTGGWRMLNDLSRLPAWSSVVTMFMHDLLQELKKKKLFKVEGQIVTLLNYQRRTQYMFVNNFYNLWQHH